jgi:hypothetical protein
LFQQNILSLRNANDADGEKPLKTKRFNESPPDGLRAIGNFWR